jgi:hypothetical protein
MKFNHQAALGAMNNRFIFAGFYIKNEDRVSFGFRSDEEADRCYCIYGISELKALWPLMQMIDCGGHCELWLIQDLTIG